MIWNFKQYGKKQRMSFKNYKLKNRQKRRRKIYKCFETKLWLIFPESREAHIYIFEKSIPQWTKPPS